MRLASSLLTLAVLAPSLLAQVTLTAVPQVGTYERLSADFLVWRVFRTQNDKFGAGIDGRNAIKFVDNAKNTYVVLPRLDDPKSFHHWGLSVSENGKHVAGYTSRATSNTAGDVPSLPIRWVLDSTSKVYTAKALPLPDVVAIHDAHAEGISNTGVSVGYVIVGQAGGGSKSEARRWANDELGTAFNLKGLADADWVRAKAISGDSTLIGGTSGNHAVVWRGGPALKIADLLTKQGVDTTGWVLGAPTTITGTPTTGFTLVGNASKDGQSTGYKITGLQVPNK